MAADGCYHRRVPAQDLTLLSKSVAAAATHAGTLLGSYFQDLSSLAIEQKSSNVDLVSKADRDAEDLIRRELYAIDSTIGFIGEESEGADVGESGMSWVVDPLDGTSNYLSGLPQWCVSIALCDAGLEPKLGVVHAPLLGKTWTAVRGAGTYLNDKPVSVRLEPPGGGLRNVMLGTGFPYDIGAKGDSVALDRFVRMQLHFHKIRRMGSAAIDLALVADGTFDGMWEESLSPWDTAAGILLVTEAGGHVARFNGSPYRPGDPDLLVAATATLQDEMYVVLSDASAED